MAKKNNSAETIIPAGVAGTDLNAFLAGASAKKPAKGRRETPVLTGLGKLADAAHRAYKLFKDSEAGFRKAESALMELVAPKYEQGAKSGDFSKSYNVEGEETGGVQVKWQDRFKPRSFTDEVLKEVLGDKVGQYYTTQRKLTAAEPTDQDIQDLIAALGPDRFKLLFKIEINYQAKPGMDLRQFELPILARPEQYKASLVIKGGDESDASGDE